MKILYVISDSYIIAAIAWVVRLVLNPVVPGALLAILAYGPDAARAQLLDVIVGRLHLTPSAVATTLKVLLGLGTLRSITSTLDVLSANNYRLGEAPGWNWPKEVAVVTGGSSGIGEGIVKRLASKSIKVAVLDVNPLPASLQGNPNIRFYKTDVTSPQSVAQAADAVRKDFGNASILVNNAGITRPFPILEIPEANLQKIFSVNTMSHWTLCQQFVPAMVKANKGHIVTVASVASFVPLPGAADYSCTKASALAFHEALGAELKFIYKAPNVLTSVIHPNFVNTPLVADIKQGLSRGGVTFMTADRVADEIVAQIYKKQGAQVIIPKASGIVSGQRGWPTWMQFLLRDAAGKGTQHVNKV